MLRSDSLKRKAILEWQLLQGEAKQIMVTDLFGQDSPFTALEKTAKPKSCARNNRSHISMSDTEAKLSQKTGKPSRLYYLSSMAVDTADVLCHPFIMSLRIYRQMERLAPMADEKDSRHLMAIVDKLSIKLKQSGLPFQCLSADAGFSSGENYSALEARHIKVFIPLHGSYHPVREGFSFDTIGNAYVCRNKKLLYYHGIKMDKGFANHYYHARVKRTDDAEHQVRL